jgi:dolichol-phosphate mannosyltransferase
MKDRTTPLKGTPSPGRRSKARRTWIVLPAFNEADNLPAVLDGIAAVESLLRECAVVVVDDGSTDGTAEAASAHMGGLSLRVLSHPGNRGLARTIDTGIRAAIRNAGADDVVVTMDADNTHSPALIPRLLRRIEQGADVVIASRYTRGGREDGVPLTRRILSRAIGILLRLRFGLCGVRDYSSGYRAYRARLLQAALAAYGDRFIESDGFQVMAEVLVKLSVYSPRIAEVPLHLRYDRKHGQSKIRLLPTVAGYLWLLAAPRPRMDRERAAAGAPMSRGA